MKILGKKSLSSRIMIGLIMLLVIGVAITLAVGIGMILWWEKWTNIFLTKTLFISYLSSIPALTMIIQFIKIFQNLKEEKIFEQENAKRLKINYISSFVISGIYIMNTIILLPKITTADALIIEVIFMAVIAMVFLIFGIGLIVLKEIYQKAIEYKEENELTI